MLLGRQGGWEKQVVGEKDDCNQYFLFFPVCRCTEPQECPQTGLGEKEGEQEEQAEDSPLPHPQECRRQSGEGLRKVAETNLEPACKEGDRPELWFRKELSILPDYLT